MMHPILFVIPSSILLFILLVVTPMAHSGTVETLNGALKVASVEGIPPQNGPLIAAGASVVNRNYWYIIQSSPYDPERRKNIHLMGVG